jgi:hypothetical protein
MLSGECGFGCLQLLGPVETLIKKTKQLVVAARAFGDPISSLKSTGGG